MGWLTLNSLYHSDTPCPKEEETTSTGVRDHPTTVAYSSILSFKAVIIRLSDI